MREKSWNEERSEGYVGEGKSFGIFNQLLYQF